MVSPIRSASITALLSPKEMVREFTKRGSQDFGIQDYNLPKSGLPQRGRSGVIPKNKTPGPIESEARYRKQFPGAGAYTLKHDKPWNEQAEPGQSKPSMAKSPRISVVDEIAKSASKTPSPNDYTFDKLKFLPSLSRGGAALLQA